MQSTRSGMDRRQSTQPSRKPSEELLDKMARLAKNFPHMKNITPELIEDRARDVQGFTLEVVDKACELLRRSEEFFPSASRLVETCERLRDTQKASSYNAYCG